MLFKVVFSCVCVFVCVFVIVCVSVMVMDDAYRYIYVPSMYNTYVCVLYNINGTIVCFCFCFSFRILPL